MRHKKGLSFFTVLSIVGIVYLTFTQLSIPSALILIFQGVGAEISIPNTLREYSDHKIALVVNIVLSAMIIIYSRYVLDKQLNGDDLLGKFSTWVAFFTAFILISGGSILVESYNWFHFF